MRVLFVPYSPSKASQKRGETSDISPQKHAAREHHRKAKLLKKAARKDDQLAAHADGKELTRHRSRWNVQWPHNDNEEPPHAIREPRTILGEGRLDPFDAYCTRGQPLIVHEMLDHGESALVRRWM